MYMFTSYGHIKNPKSNHRFFADFSLGQLSYNQIIETRSLKYDK